MVGLLLVYVDVLLLFKIKINKLSGKYKAEATC